MLLIIYVFNDGGLLHTTLKLMIIYMLIAFTGFTDGFVSPSRMSLIPESVEEKALGKANSLISTTDQTFALLGWSIGTIAINIYGSNFYAMNTTAGIALLLVVLMGPFYQLRDISQLTYIQKNVVGLAKLYAAKDNLYYIVFALSVFLSGLISDYIGVVYVYYFAFILYLQLLRHLHLEEGRK